MEITEDYQMLLSTISHEIRNPVTLINSYLQLLSDTHPEIISCSYWDTIQSEMMHLRLLLGDISSYQNGLLLRTLPTDMHLWLLEYIDAITPLLDEYPQVQFTYEIKENLPTLEIDVCRFRQVMDNLVRNALEALALSFSGSPENAKQPQYPPRLHLKAFVKEDTLFISVMDNGCGISPEQLSTLFDPFVTHKPGGTGLGLSIARRIIDAHDGNLTVAASDSNMTAFEIQLPVKNRQ